MRFSGKAWLSVFGYALLLAGVPTYSHAVLGEWPRLEKGAGKPLCEEALRIARAAFNSNTFSIDDPAAFPDDPGNRFVIKPRQMDISDGNGIASSGNVFEKISETSRDESEPGKPYAVYWQKKPENGWRFLLTERSFGWRGDTYTLLAAREDVSFEEATAIEGKAKVLIDDVMRPPFLFQGKATSKVWALDVDFDHHDFVPYRALTAWRVFSLSAQGGLLNCVIYFRPSGDILKSLPRSVTRFATLLDGALGHEKGGGTYRPVGQLRFRVERIWANIALRPWALPEETIGSRENVDAGLREWSKRGARFQKTYREIQHAYPRAEAALAKYYEARFVKSPPEAKALARHALDIAYRSSFTFSDE